MLLKNIIDNNISLFCLCFFLSFYFLPNNNYSYSNSFPAHDDEPSVVETAIRISDGSLNPQFFRYPSGHMNILAIIYKIIEFFNGELTKENYYSIAWVFSRICIAGIAAMVFLICSININYYFGILGIILTVLNTTLYTHENYAIVDVPMAFFITLFFLILTLLYSKSNWRVRDITFLSLITGIAIAMKYTAGLLVPALFFVSTQYIQKKKTYIIPIEMIKKTLFYFGLFLLSVYATIIMNQEYLLTYFKGLTTDGILEIEYILYTPKNKMT